MKGIDLATTLFSNDEASIFLEKVSAITASLRELFPATPLQYSAYLSQKYNAEIWLKREDLTPVRSYKIRGAYHFFSKYIKESAGKALPSFVCASAGNHSQGFATVCKYFNTKGVVFMPITTPQQKVAKTKAFGEEWVEIRQIGDTFDDCYAAAQSFAKEQDAVMVPPFDHPDIILGQATIAEEIMEEWTSHVDPDYMIVPVGGGGLSSALANYMAAKQSNCELLLAEPAGAASLYRSLKAGERLKLPLVDTFVDGASVAEIGFHNYKALQNFSVNDIHIVPENRLCATMLEMLNIEGIVLEPAGALAIDSLKDFTLSQLQGKKIVLIVSGGNFDFERLPDVKERAQRYQGLKKYFIFKFPQRPGALKSFLELLGPDDDIARFEYLKKSARDFGSVMIGIETNHPENFTLLYERFSKAGWQYRDITDDHILANFVI